MGLFTEAVCSVLGSNHGSSFQIDEKNWEVNVGFTSRNNRKNAWYAWYKYDQNGKLIDYWCGMPGAVIAEIKGNQIQAELQRRIRDSYQ